jgi:hypothetical protein
MTISPDLLDIDTIAYPEEDDLPMAEGYVREYFSYATKVLRIFSAGQILPTDAE